MDARKKDRLLPQLPTPDMEDGEEVEEDEEEEEGEGEGEEEEEEAEGQDGDFKEAAKSLIAPRFCPTCREYSRPVRTWLLLLLLLLLLL